VRRAIFYRQLLTELWLFAHRTDDAFAALEGAVHLGLPDGLWIENCPLLLKVAADPRLGPLRDQVASRARVVRDVLTGREPRSA
jgi:hypothetical protein